MKKGTIVGLVGALTVISFLAGLFVDRQLHHSNHEKWADEVARLKADLQAAQQETNDVVSDSRPKLWLDQDAAEAVQRLGYDHVFFVRWQNGVVDGWVEFEEAAGPKRSPLNFSRSTIDQWAQVCKRPVAKGSKGHLLLALRQVGKTDEFDCELYAYWMLQQEQEGIFASGSGGAAKGKHKVKLETDPKNNTRLYGPWLSKPFEISVNRYVTEQAVPWMNLKLVELPK